MHRICLPIYKYFQKHQILMYVVMFATLAFFGYFGFQLRFEEDIIKLLPRAATSNELAFSEIELAGKIFVQVTSRDPENPVDPSRLGDISEEYCTLLEETDSSTHYILGTLSTLDTDTAFGAMDFALSHLPSFVDENWYTGIEQALTQDAINHQMEENYELIMEDETGMASQLVAMDPLNLRTVVLGALLDDSSAMGGFTMEDGHLFCPDKTVALAFITPSFGYTNSGDGTRLWNLMKKAQTEIEAANPDVRILVHGNVPNSVSNASTIKRDLAYTLGLSLLLILIIMLMSFHNLSWVWQQVVPVIYGAVFAMACLFWIKGFMSLMALGISAIVLGVAISYCLHVLIHFYYVGDAEQMLREESTPVFLGCLTTIGAFMGLLFTESDLLRDFGLFSTFALIGNTIFALVFLPHFLKPKQIKFKRQKGFPLVERINNLPWDRNKWIIGTLIVLIIVGAAFSPKVKFDSDLRNLNYISEEVQESMDLYNTKNADGYTHQYFAAWGMDLDSALEYNKGFHETLDSLHALGQVKGYSPLTRLLFISQKDQETRIQAWKDFWTPGRIKEVRRNLAVAARNYELPEDLFDSFINLLGAEYEPGNLIESDIIPAGLLSNYIEKQVTGRYMVFTDISYEQDEQEHVWKTLAACDHVFVLDPFYYCRDMVEIVHDDFNTTLWISSLFVLLVLLISFRNLWIALVAYFPMFISWYVMQGYMALFGLEFNLINIVISTFIYGIGVDYSIFVMEGLLAEARQGEKSMLEFHKVAIFYSALVLAIVTFSLIFARHPSIHSIGIITLIGMASTILITYSLQPWIFRMLCKVPFFRKGFRIPDVPTKD